MFSSQEKVPVDIKKISRSPSNAHSTPRFEESSQVTSKRMQQIAGLSASISTMFLGQILGISKYISTQQPNTVFMHHSLHGCL